MKKLHILDVTLRDGGLRNKNNFGEKVSCDVVSTLDAIGLDYIEFTLRIPSPKALNLNGENDFLKLIRNQAPHAKLAVMCIPEIINDDEFAQMKHCGMDLVRFAFQTSSDLETGLRKIAAAKSAGLAVSANFTCATQWSKSLIESFVSNFLSAGADIIYLADSSGSMIPADVEKYMDIIQKLNPPHVGFHAHDNLGLALMNSLTAIDCGADFIDSSLRGMGNSSGNLKTETLLVYLNKTQNYSFDLQKLLNLSSQFEQWIPESTPVHTPQQMWLGLLDLPENPEDQAKIVDIAQCNNLNSPSVLSTRI
ncbi:MAG: hypothetical protein Q8L78_08980 [Coxiellaceae bacterium]|nr:hypothetical protein [Coxiellaceae bacterium]